MPGLADPFKLLVYDRRGHCRSQRPSGPGSVDEDGDDLAAFVGGTRLGPGAPGDQLLGRKYRVAVSHQAAGRIPLSDLP